LTAGGGVDDAGFLGFRWMVRYFASESAPAPGSRQLAMEVESVGGVPEVSWKWGTDPEMERRALMAFGEERRWSAGVEEHGFENAMIRVLVSGDMVRCDAVVLMAGLLPMALTVDTTRGTSPWKSNRGLHYSGLWPAVRAERERALTGACSDVSTVVGPCPPGSRRARWGRLFSHKWG
jgi:hypothetical protein